MQPLGAFPLPIISAWDPRATSSGSLDPLGTLRAYTAIATTLLPGATTITTRPRGLSWVCADLRLVDELPGPPRGGQAGGMVQLTDSVLLANVATTYGGGVYVASTGTVECTGATPGPRGFLANVAGSGGGGAYLAVSGATLRARLCDWGTTPSGTDNAPADIQFVSNTYQKENDATFTCTAGTCP